MNARGFNLEIQIQAERLNVSEKNKNVNLLTRSKLEKRVNQAENKSSPKVSSDQVNNEKSKTEKSSGLEQINNDKSKSEKSSGIGQINNDKSKTEKSSGMEQIDAYFDKKLYHNINLLVSKGSDKLDSFLFSCLSTDIPQ
jgi:hypothetical protein